MTDDFERLKDEIEEELEDFNLDEDFSSYSKKELKDLISKLYDELKRKDKLLLDLKEKISVLTDMVMKRSDRMIDLQDKVKDLNKKISDLREVDKNEK